MSDKKIKDNNNESDINYRNRSFGTSRMRDQNRDNSHTNYNYYNCNHINNSHKSIDEFKNNDSSRSNRRLDSKSGSRFKYNERLENVDKYYPKSAKRREYQSKSDKHFDRDYRNSDQKQNDSKNCNKNVEKINENCSKKEEKSCETETKSNNIELKLDELTALKSIFDEKVLTIDETQLKGRFLAEPVITETPYLVVYRKINYKNKDNKQTKEEFEIKHLPPIELYFELPEDYPSKSHPMFLIFCKWLTLSDLDNICDKLECLWNESKIEILYTWFSFLQYEVLNWLGYSTKLDITRIINVKPKWITKTESNFEPNKQNSSKDNNITTVSKSALSSNSRRNGKNEKFVIEFKPQLNRGLGRYDQRAACDLIGVELITHLKAYNEFKEKEVFNKSYITCNICFSLCLGEESAVFPCNHMACRKCIKEYFTTLVTEGSVNLLKCPEPKCETSAPPNLVKELISAQLFKKYDELLKASVIASMADIYYCPRKMCGIPVVAESDSSLAHCTNCSYAFCKNCKFSYHGLDPCQIFRNAKERKEILDKYREATGHEKQQLEKLYGKKQLIEALEEAATEKWLEDMSKRCPHCKASIEKSDGCNKMSCWKCNTYFCWLCLQQLSPTLPYSHFNNPESKCFNQLFRGVNFDQMQDLYEDIVD